jgi:serine/threonine protein kinase
MQGRFFKHYEVLELLGRGGMGEVYLAMDTTLERKVALKFLPRSLMNDPAAQGRLFDEARSCSRIQHPNIAVIHSIEEDGGVYALCMEYVEGRTLREILAGHELSLNRVTRIGRAIAAGMTAAHEQGVIHRDLKPANVMLTKRGEVKIMDFGLALRPQRIVTTAGPNSFGTVSYMSPEQARGDTPTSLSDIFSFGTTMYELLTRRPPFEGENDLTVLQSIINDDPPPLRELRRNIPPAIEHTIRRCMAKDPGERFPSMAAVAAELQYVEPVVEAGPKDLIHELASELTAPNPKPPTTRRGPSGPTPRSTEDSTAGDGLPPIAPVLTVPLAETLVENALSEDSSSVSRSHRRRKRADASLRSSRVNELWRDASRSIQTSHVRTDSAYRTHPSRMSRSIPSQRPEQRTQVSHRTGGPPPSAGRIAVMIIKLLFGLLLAGLGAFQLMRAAGVEIRFRPPAEETTTSAPAQSSNITGMDLRESVGKIISKAKDQVSAVTSAKPDSTEKASEGEESEAPTPSQPKPAADGDGPSADVERGESPGPRATPQESSDAAAWTSEATRDLESSEPDPGPTPGAGPGAR